MLKCFKAGKVPFVRRLCLAVAVFGLVGGCEDQQASTPSQAVEPPTVTIAAVQRKDVTPSYQYVGRIEAIESVNLVARVEGFLEKVEFKEGSNVKAGQVLYQIEQDTYVAEVAARKADLAKAQASLDNNRVQLERAKKLIQKGNISQAKLDDITADEKRSVADVQQKQASLVEAELNLKYTIIITAIDGRIGRTNVTVGNLVDKNSGVLATVVGLDPIYVKVAVSDRDLLDLRRREPKDPEGRSTPYLRLSDGQDYDYPGEFAFIDNTVDSSTDTIAVRATFPNPDALLLPDQFVTVIIKRSQPIAALVIPQTAVQEDQSGRFVLVVDQDDKVVAQQVKLGAQDGTDWVVKEGLQEGQNVIVQGLQKVRPGIKVNPVPVAKAAASGS